MVYEELGEAHVMWRRTQGWQYECVLRYVILDLEAEECPSLPSNTFSRFPVARKNITNDANPALGYACDII